jgi:hypothetical protein
LTSRKSHGQLLYERIPTKDTISLAGLNRSLAVEAPRIDNDNAPPTDRYDSHVSNPPVQPWPPLPMAKRRRWPLIVLAMAQLAIATIAIAAWFRPMPTNKPSPTQSFTEQQMTEAKSKVCAAFNKVHNAVNITSARDRGADYTTQLASAVNARQALVAGSQYLLTTLNNEPATPVDLAKEIRNLTNAYQLLTVDLLAEAPESDINASVSSGDAASSKLEDLCK